MAKRSTGGDQTRGPLTDAERQQIIDLAAQGVSRNDIVRTVGRAAGTVTKVARAAGYEFDREQTKQATEAAKADLAFMRAMLEEETLRQVGMGFQRLTSKSVIREFDRNAAVFVEHVIPAPDHKAFSDIAKGLKDLAAVAKYLAEANRATTDTQDDLGAVDTYLSQIDEDVA